MIRPVKYLQGDSRWGKNNYSASGESKTISSSGCGPTAAAMVIQTLRPDITVTPAETAKWSMENGYKYKNQGTAYAYFVPQFSKYGLHCRMVNSSDARNLSEASKNSIQKKIREALKNEGSFVIACMGPGNWTSRGHYVVAYDIDSSYVYINDPASTSISREKGPIALFFAQAKYFWIVKWGSKNKIVTKGKVFQKMDILSKKIEDIWTQDIVWYVRDMRNGWGIVCTDDKVGYCKNNRMSTVGKSQFPQGKLIKDCYIHEKNNKLSKKITLVKEGITVQIVTKRKYWTYVAVSSPYGEDSPNVNIKGWIKTKLIQEVEKKRKKKG